MSRPVEAIMYDPAPLPTRSYACPDTTKTFARWQSGLETPSGCKQWKLRLRLVSESTCDEHFHATGNPTVRSLQSGERFLQSNSDEVKREDVAI